MVKVDLHTHSIDSPDGGITTEQYAKALATGLLDCIAVTDHNSIDFALKLNGELGDKIIVGEEIMTNSGEIIGLFLTSKIRPNLSPLETIKQIKDQGGIVYIPHPFETVRKGLPAEVLEELIEYIDLVEVVNGRAFLQNRSSKSAIFAKLNRIRVAASSDAHGIKGLGRTYTLVETLPTQSDFLEVMSGSKPVVGRPGPRALLYPKYHRLKKRLGRN